MTIEPRTRTRNRRGDGARLRDELLAAATRLLRREGRQDALSIRAITREAGASPQSFYLHFADLDALIRALYEAGFVDLHAHLDRAAARAVDDHRRGRPGAASSREEARAALRGLAAAYLDYAETHPGDYALLFETQGTPHDWHDLPGDATIGLVRDLVVAAGLDRAGERRDPDGAAVALWATLHGAATLRRAMPAFPWPEPGRLLDHALAARAAREAVADPAASGAAKRATMEP